MTHQYWGEKNKRNMRYLEESGNPRLSRMTPSPAYFTRDFMILREAIFRRQNLVAYNRN